MSNITYYDIVSINVIIFLSIYVSHFHIVINLTEQLSGKQHNKDTASHGEQQSVQQGPLTEV